MGFLIGIIVILVGFFFGRMAEKNHFKQLQIAEGELSNILATNLKSSANEAAQTGALVTGNVVVANDAFKSFFAFFSLLFGGRIGVYETLMERARREAVVRMKREAKAMGASEVINIRIETSTMTGKAGTVGGIEMLAYGTALVPA